MTDIKILKPFEAEVDGKPVAFAEGEVRSIEDVDVEKILSLGLAERITPKVALTPSRAPELVVDKNSDFKSVGEFIKAIYVQKTKGITDSRLSKMMSAGTDAAGGYSIPTEWGTNYPELIVGSSQIASRCMKIVTSSQNFNLPYWDGLRGGLSASFVADGGLITPATPAMGMLEMKLKGLKQLVPIGNQLENTTAISSLVSALMIESLTAGLENAIINGAGGASDFDGILGSTAIISIAKETSQVADTLVMENVTNMWARLLPSSQVNAVWIMSPEVAAALTTLAPFASGSTLNYNLFVPQGGLANFPSGNLYGRPILVTEFADKIGDKGDIILADLSKYILLMRAVRLDVSTENLFNYDAISVRAVLECDGAPWLSAAYSPANGGATLSHFVTLDARA